MAVSGDNYILQTGTNATQDCSQRIVARDQNSGTKIERKTYDIRSKHQKSRFYQMFFPHKTNLQTLDFRVYTLIGGKGSTQTLG